jgi:hypothetical protein
LFWSLAEMPPTIAAMPTTTAVRRATRTSGFLDLDEAAPGVRPVR